MITFSSKLSERGTTIFTIMSSLANQHEAINLGQGFPDFDCDDELKSLVNKYLYAEKNQYCPMPGLFELRSAICDKMNKTYSLNFSPESQICITAGATQAIFTIISAFVKPKDEVIIIEPAYDSYIPSVEINGGTPVIYQMTFPDYSINWNRFEGLITDKTRMIIINTPHNPTGTILSHQDMLNLQSLVRDKNIIILSDEVYEHLVYDDLEHYSPQRYSELANQTISVYSFGKTFHSTGWKIGYCLGPQNLIAEFKNVHQWNVFSVNSFLQYALADYLQVEETYNNLSMFYQKKRDLLSNSLSSTALIPEKCQGTYFQLYYYGALSDKKDFDFATYLTTELGVAAIPLSPFYSEDIEDKVIRLCFAKKNATLLSAADRLQKLKS